jgi:hypothetical protein
MAYNLFLDDIRTPKVAASYMHPDYADMLLNMKWITCKDYKEFVNLISNTGLPEWIAFDHDLADEHYSVIDTMDWETYNKQENREMTGLDCAKWLVEYCMEHKKPLPKYFIHSMNDVGLHNIKSYLENYKKHCE